MKAIFEPIKKIKVEYSETRTILIGWYQQFISAYYYMLSRNNTKIAKIDYFSLTIDEFCRTVSQGKLDIVKQISPLEELAINSCINLVHLLTLKINKNLELTNNATIAKLKSCDGQNAPMFTHKLNLSAAHQFDGNLGFSINSSNSILKMICLDALHTYCTESIIADLNYLCCLIAENYDNDLDSSVSIVPYKEFMTENLMIEAFYTANISTVKYVDFVEQYLGLVQSLKFSILKYIYTIQEKIELAHVMQIVNIQYLAKSYKNFDFDGFQTTLHKLSFLSTNPKKFDIEHSLDTIDVSLIASFIKISQTIYSESQMRVALLNKFVDINQALYVTNQCKLFVMNLFINIDKKYSIEDAIVAKIAIISHFINLDTNIHSVYAAKASLLNKLLSIKPTQTISTLFNSQMINKFVQMTKASYTDFNFDELDVYNIAQFVYPLYSSTLSHQLTLTALQSIVGMSVDIAYFDAQPTIKQLSLLSKFIHMFEMGGDTDFITDVFGLDKYFSIEDSSSFVNEIISIQKHFNPNSQISLTDIGNYYDFVNAFNINDSVALKVLSHIIAINKSFDIEVVSDIDVNAATMIDMMVEHILLLEAEIIKLANVKISNSGIIDVVVNIQTPILINTESFASCLSELQIKYIDNVELQHYLSMLSSAELVYRHYLQCVCDNAVVINNQLDLFQSLDNNILFTNPEFSFVFKALLSLGNEVALETLCQSTMDLYVAVLTNGSCFNEDGLLNYHGFLLEDSFLLEDYILYA